MVTRLRVVKKPIDDDSQAFIEVVRTMIAKPGGDQASAIAALKPKYKKVATQLDQAARAGGPDDMWRVYDALDTDNKWLVDLRSPIVKVESADQGQGGEQEDKRFTTSPTGQRLLKFDRIEDVYLEPDPEYLITKIIEIATVGLLYGMSGTGKTFTALDMALCIAHGLYWHGRRVRQGHVWYVNTEGKRGLKKRLQAWYLQHDDLTLSPHFHAITWRLDINDNFLDIMSTLDALPLDEQPVLIVLDNFSLIASGVNQNHQEEISPILSNLGELAARGPHVLLIHHTNKEEKFNGSMAFRNHVDSMIELKKEDSADKDSPILFTSAKARDDEPFGDIRTELKQIVLRTDDQGEEITSCVIVESELPARSPIAALKQVEQDCLDILVGRTMGFTEWQKECTRDLGISTATFSRKVKTLEDKRLVIKTKVAGKKFTTYQAVEDVSGVNDDDN